MLEISVIIPVYNGETYLEKAIKSVLNQTHKPKEILVIDDGSRDNSADIARKFGSIVRVVSQTHQGVAVARNHGIKLAKSAYLSFLDADDYWLPNKLALQFPHLETTPLIFGHIKHFYSPDLPEQNRAKLLCPPNPKAGYLPSTFICHADVFEKVGLFNPQWRSGEFIDWYGKTRQTDLKSYLLKETVAMRRIHANNATRQRENLRDYLHILKGLTRTPKAN